jgi:hypothetical protein
LLSVFRVQASYEFWQIVQYPISHLIHILQQVLKLREELLKGYLRSQNLGNLMDGVTK